MKKEQYNEPIMMVLCFGREDVVKTSSWTDVMPTSEINETGDNY